MGNPSYQAGFQLTLHEQMLNYPLKWRKPCRIFVNSMSDLFHEDVPEEFIFKTFEVMRSAKQHQFQILTKRSQRLRKINSRLDWAENIWMGVSVENQDYAWRIDDLRATSAHHKFLSVEPLLGSLSDVNIAGMDWVIVGGESGPGARPMKPEWAIEIRNKCVELAIPFFFKQWGGFNKKKNGRTLDGRIWDEMPT